MSIPLWDQHSPLTPWLLSTLSRIKKREIYGELLMGDLLRVLVIEFLTGQSVPYHCLMLRPIQTLCHTTAGKRGFDAGIPLLE